jgi:hypothetical protein
MYIVRLELPDSTNSAHSQLASRFTGTPPADTDVRLTPVESMTVLWRARPPGAERRPLRLRGRLVGHCPVGAGFRCLAEGGSTGFAPIRE